MLYEDKGLQLAKCLPTTSPNVIPVHLQTLRTSFPCLINEIELKGETSDI